MSLKPSQNEPLLTFDHVLAKRRDIVAGERHIAELTTRLDADKAQFQAMLLFVSEAQRQQILTATWESLAPDLFTPQTPREAPKEAATSAKVASSKPAVAVQSSPRKLKVVKRATGAGSFTHDVVELLKHAPNGFSHTDLMAELSFTKHADRVTTNEAKGYYRTLSKLVMRGALKRHAGKMYHPQVFEKLNKAGELPSADGMGVRQNGAAHIALEVLQRHPVGLTGPELKVRVGAHADAPKSVSEHGQYIYNVLATLMGSGRVIKDGPLYRIAEMAKPRANGASVPHASDPAR